MSKPGLRRRLDFKRNRNRYQNRTAQLLNGIGIGTLKFFQAVIESEPESAPLKYFLTGIRIGNLNFWLDEFFRS